MQRSGTQAREVLGKILKPGSAEANTFSKYLLSCLCQTWLRPPEHSRETSRRRFCPYGTYIQGENTGGNLPDEQSKKKMKNVSFKVNYVQNEYSLGIRNIWLTV